MVSKVIKSWGGEGYVDYADMKEKLGLDTVATSLKFQTLDLFGTQNEVWMEPSTFTGFTVKNTFDPTINGVVEIEASTAMYMQSVVGVGTSINDFIEIGNVANLLLARDPITNQITYMGGSGPTGATAIVDNPIKLKTGQLFYATVRVRAENGTANDGIVEVYINGDLIYKSINCNTGTISTAQIVKYGEPSSNFTTYYRNVSVRDGWSTAEDIAPVPVYIQSLPITDVTGSYTIEGGASTQLDALTDGDDTTYITSSVPSETATIGFTPDPSLATFPVQYISGSVDVSRSSAAPNIITCDVQDDGTSMATPSTFNISTIAPYTDRFEFNIEVTPTVLTDLELVISNGS